MIDWFVIVFIQENQHHKLRFFQINWKHGVVIV
jgi:hypothetical protein